MKRANKVYCLVLALIAVSAMAVPLVFHHGAGRAGNEAALQLDGGSQPSASGATADVGASHIGSDGPPTIGASFADIEHFSFRPVMGDINDSHAGSDGVVLNVGNMLFPAGTPSASSAQSYGADASAFGIPGAAGGYGGAGMAFNLPFGSTPMRSGAAPSAPVNAAYLPLALLGSDAGPGNGAGYTDGNPNANAGGKASDIGPGGLDGAGGTPGITEGVFNPTFGAPLNDGLPETADAGGASSVDVPEPTTIALFGFGLLGFAASRRRAAKRAAR